MDIKSFRDEYAEQVSSYENLNTVGGAFEHLSLRKRYNSLLESASRKKKFLQYEFCRHFPKKTADFKKMAALLEKHDEFDTALLLLKEFPELCEGVEMHLLDFILYLWKKKNELFLQNAKHVLECVAICPICRYLYHHLDFYPDMGLVIGDLFRQTDDKSQVNEISLMMWAVSSEVKQPSPRQIDFLKLFK